MTGVPEYEIPYQFGYTQPETYEMVLNLYLADVMLRVKAGHSLADVIRADVRKSVAWNQRMREEVSRETT